MNIETQIHLDKFQLRPYQAPLWDAIENKGYRNVLAVLPRRARQRYYLLESCHTPMP